MNAIRDAVVEYLKSQVTQLLLIPAGALVLVFFTAHVVPPAATAEGARVLLSLLAAALALAATALIQLWKATRQAQLRARFGCYWDGGLNPHYPTCKTLLHSYGWYRIPDHNPPECAYGYRCSKCQSLVFLRPDDASRPTIEQVRERLTQGTA